MSFLTSLLGPAKGLSKEKEEKEVAWRHFCSDIGGEFVRREPWQSDMVVAKVKQWVITLDTCTVPRGEFDVGETYTRVMAPYVNADEFRFTIYRKGLFSRLWKLLGMQDIEIGCPDFDRDFIIKGNDESKVRILCANPRIRRLIECQQSFRFQIKSGKGWFSSGLPERVDALWFEADGVITDMHRLGSIYELFVETLDHLACTGPASEEEPQRRLGGSEQDADDRASWYRFSRAENK
jgi:hypothetical protein